MSKTLTTSILSVLAFAITAHAEETTSELPITVTATRFKQSINSETASTTIISKDDIQRQGWQTIAEALKNQPSLEIASNGGKAQNTTLYMRGFNSEQVLILVDGMRLGRSAMGGADLSSIPMTQVERIEIIRGARATIYGSDAIAGVINIITRSDSEENYLKVKSDRGSYNYSNYEVSGLNGLSQQDTIKAGLNYSQEDGYNVYPVLGKNDGDTQGYWNKNAMSNYTHEFDNGFSIFTSGRWMQKQYASVNTSTGAYVQSYYQDQAYQTSLEKNTGKWLSSWTIQYSDTDYFYGFARNQDRDDATYRNYNDQTTLGWFNQYSLNNNIKLGGGVDWIESRLKDGSASYSSSKWTSMNGINHNSGIYSLAEYRNNSVTAEVSGRVDDNANYGSYDTYRMGTTWMFLPQTRLLVNYSTSFRAPTLLNLYYPTGGNLNLEPETAQGGELGFDGDFDLFDWKVMGYRTIVDNMIDYDSTTKKYQNIKAAELEGVEFEFGFTTDMIKHHISADFANPIDSTNGKQLARRSKNNYKWQAETSWNKWDFATSIVYAGERFDDKNNTNKLGGYTLWNISSGYHFTDQFRVGARIDNLFDKDYVTAAGYETPGRNYYINFLYQL